MQIELPLYLCFKTTRKYTGEEELPYRLYVVAHRKEAALISIKHLRKLWFGPLIKNFLKCAMFIMMPINKFDILAWFYGFGALVVYVTIFVLYTTPQTERLVYIIQWRYQFIIKFTLFYLLRFPLANPAHAHRRNFRYSLFILFCYCSTCP